MHKLIPLLLAFAATTSIAEAATHGGAAAPYTAPVPFQIGSRFYQPTNIAGLSNGTNTGQNTRISSINESGATVNAVRLVFPNWYANTANNETIGPNSIIVTASLEYPAGTYNQMTWAHVPVTTVNSGANSLTDVITLTTPIPSGAQFWVRTYVSVTAGNQWPQADTIDTALGEASESGTSETDKTMGAGSTH